MATDPIKERQRRVSKQGSEFENHVLASVNKQLRDCKSAVEVISESAAKVNRKIREQLLIKTSAGVSAWGDADLVAIKGEKVVAVISCKLSLHGRLSETLFYSLVYKEQIPAVKVVFVTPDKGKQAKEEVWQSEWSSEDKPGKDRLLAETFLNGVYVDNDFLKNYFPTKYREYKTKLGGKIKGIAELAIDLDAWGKTL